MDLSILITNFNYGRYVDDCIYSCLSLTKPYVGFKYEILVVDDGSTDSSVDILKKHHDSVEIVYIKNRGVEAAANCIYRMSQGEFIVRVDADDLLYKDFLVAINESWKLAKSDDSTAFIYTDYDEINEDGEFIREIKLPVYSMEEIGERGDFLATGTVMKRSTLPNLLYREDNKNCGLENYELILTLLENGYKGIHVDSKGFLYRRHSKSLSSLKKKSIVKYGREMMKNFSFDEFKANEYHPYNLEVDSLL